MYRTQVLASGIVAAALLGACDRDDSPDPNGDTGSECAASTPQPTLGSRVHPLLTESVDVTNETGEDCTVELSFRDLNGNGTLEPYEDWRRSSTERVTDLLGRMSDAERQGLLAHPVLSESPETDTTVSSRLRADVETRHIRFGVSTSRNADLDDRATWANALQEVAEATGHGIPFVLSSEAAHMVGHSRLLANDFSELPYELGLGATGDAAVVQTTGALISEELGAVGIRMYLDVPADLYTDPRWYQGQFTFGDDASVVSSLVSAYVEGLDSSTDKAPTAAAVGHFPGAGAAKGGWDARLEKGRYLTYPSNQFDTHLAPFEAAIAAGAPAIMMARGIPEAGAWTGTGGLDGSTLPQVGASFSSALVNDTLRGALGFDGVVLAPPGVLTDVGAAPLATPWGVETLTPAERLGTALAAGVDQFVALDNPGLVAEAISAGDATSEHVDTAAAHILTMMFELGSFENPYVDAEVAPGVPSGNLEDARDALGKAMVLLVNADKPAGWLNGMGDGSQTGDKGNAGNGSGKVLPAPPGIPYVTPGCSFFIMGDLDFEYVNTVSAGYGTLTNNATEILQFPTPTDEVRIPRSNYVFIRLPSTFSEDPEGAAFGLPDQRLSYDAEDPGLADLAFARAAIDSFEGDTKTQIVVGIDAGRLPVLDEILAYGPSAIVVTWMGLTPENADSDKMFLDLVFGIDPIVGALPVGLPASDETVADQDEDQAGDGLSTTFGRGVGLQTESFE